MATKAQILAAAKRIVAAVKKPATRKANPAKRIGTKKPTRASQVTGKAPTKRLVKRRKANTSEGYFPNPAEVIKAHSHALPFHVYTVKSGAGPLTGKPVMKPVKLLGSFPSQGLAKQFAEQQFVAVGVFKD